MYIKTLPFLAFALALATDVRARDDQAGNDLFTGPVPALRLEIPPEGMRILRQYHQVWRQQRPERIDVRATVREGEQVYPDVAVHLKGSFSFQPIDAKPSLTLNFDKFVPGRRFHGLTKIHLNNSVQDPTGLCEQFARELFQQHGIPGPRATPALVHLNGRDLGLCVLVEGANKSFVRRNFGAPAAAKGSLYDGGSGGDVTKDLDLLAGEEPADRSDLKALAAAARETDPARRLARLEQALDLDQFITFAAIEAILVHWDGYTIGCNNYRLFHDTTRGKMVFMPHGLDQLFGTSSSPDMSLTPVFKGLIAKSLFAVPEARQRYFRRIAELSTTSVAVEPVHAHVDRLAKRLRQALTEEQQPGFDDAVQSLKARIVQRAASVARQLGNPPKPMRFPNDGVARLANAPWRFKRDPSYRAGASRTVVDGRDVMRLTGAGGTAAGGSWRTAVLLDEGRYEFTASARTKGVTDAIAAQTPSGVMLRISGETSTEGIAISDDWKTITYAFDVRGAEDVELVCEFRGPFNSFADFDVSSLRLTRKDPPEKPAENAAPKKPADPAPAQVP